MFSFKSGNVFDTHLIIHIHSRLHGYVNHKPRPNQIAKWNCICGMCPFSKMDWRVYMGATMLGQ